MDFVWGLGDGLAAPSVWVVCANYEHFIHLASKARDKQRQQENQTLVVAQTPGIKLAPCRWAFKADRQPHSLTADRQY